MNILKKINIKNISLILSYLTISSYIILGNCLTFNLGGRMPIKVAEIIAFFSCVILLLLHRKDVLKVSRKNFKIVFWFIIGIIPMFLYDYKLKEIAYGLLYPVRIIATLAVTIVITNVFKKYEIHLDKIFKFIINNYLIVGVVGILQLVFFPQAYDFYDIFYKIGVYFTNPDPHVDRLLSTYFDPNFLAACLIIPTILALDLFSRTGKKRYFIKIAFFITVIVLTVSRSGVAGLCMALFIYAMCTVRIKNKKLVIEKFQKRAFGVMIATAIIFIMLTLFSNVRVFKRILGTLDDESTYARVSDWSNATKIIASKEEVVNKTEEDDDDDINILFGIGYNMIGFTSSNQGKSSSAAFGNDSSLLLIAISSGMVGSVYFAVVVGKKIIIDYIERYKFKNNISIITIILTSLAVCNFNNLLFYILWLFPMFILLNLEKEKIEEQDKKNKKLTIGIDARGLNGNKAGIPTYIEEIVKNTPNKGNKYILYSNKKIKIDAKLKENIIIKDNLFPKMVGTLWLYFMLPRKLEKDEVDVFWGTQHSLPERNEYTKNIKFVLTIHDLAIAKLKTVGSFGNTIIQKVFVKRSLKNADDIISISNATKNDIVDIYKIQEEKIKVVYNGTSINSEYNLQKKDEKEIKEKLSINDSPYILFLGTIEPRKNVETLISAFDYIKEKEKTNLKLVLAGGFGWKYAKVLKLFEASKYKEDIIMPGYISKEEKEYLYKNAKCFVYPSLYEGFGLPILEAMVNGVIVVTSNNSSIPEVAENAAIYYENVLNHEELGTKILEAINLKEEEKQERINKGLEQTKKFSWEKCAKEMLEILNK